MLLMDRNKFAARTRTLLRTESLAADRFHFERQVERAPGFVGQIHGDGFAFGEDSVAHDVDAANAAVGDRPASGSENLDVAPEIGLRGVNIKHHAGDRRSPQGLPVNDCRGAILLDGKVFVIGSPDGNIFVSIDGDGACDLFGRDLRQADAKEAMSGRVELERGIGAKAFVGEIEEDRTAQVFSSGLGFAVQSFDMRRHGEIRDSIQMQFNLVVLGSARHINDELRFAVHAPQVQQFRFGALGGSAAAPNRQRIRDLLSRVPAAPEPLVNMRKSPRSRRACIQI